ncbi:MAG: hypothetical protein VX619_02720, partial [bacterium]|nr:hypothetical protein [bacterium]
MDKNSSFNPIYVILGALRTMLNRKVIHLIVLASCMSFWGCSHRFDRFGFFRPKNGKKISANKRLDQNQYLLRVAATSLRHDDSVLKEDADNFSAFFLEQLVKDNNFSVELSPDATQQFSSVANQGNPDVLRDLGKKYKVEALVRGRVKDYSYKLGRREFSVALHVEIEGINTHNSVTFFSFDKKFQRSFRLRGRRQRDMSSYNLRFLTEVMNSIKQNFDLQFEPLVVAQKSRHGGSIPTRVLADGAGAGPHSREQLMHLYLWPVSQSGKEKIGPQPLIIKSSTSQVAEVDSQKSEDVRDSLSKENSISPPQESSIDPEQLMLRSAREAEQRLSQSNLPDRLPESNDIAEKPIVELSSESTVEYDSSLNLQMPSFQLVYPEKLLANKQYQKLYYLLKDESEQVSALDLENADEEVLELEIFTTFDRTAVKKFLEDYFHGVYPSPRGKIPAVFERYYLGKLQLGFVLGNQAFVASTHRNNREIVDNTIQKFYVNNGGVTVAKILDTSIKRRKLDKIVFSKAEKTEYLPKSQEGDRDSLQVSRSIENLAITDPDVVSSARVSPIRQRQGSVDYIVDRPEVRPETSGENLGALEYEDGSIRNPYESSSERIFAEKRVNRNFVQDKGVESDLPQNVRSTNSFSSSFDEGKSDQVEITSNAGFYYDIGRRYFISNQYELSKRYMNLAHENGYRSEELDDYLNEIEKRLNPVIFNSRKNQALNTELNTAARGYESSIEKTGPAVDSGALDFDTSKNNRNLSLGSQNQRDRALEEFYSEMDKMEAELREYTNNKRQLSTSANGNYKSPSMAELAFQILAIVALVLFFLSFLSSRRITASPIYSDLSKDTNKNS